MDPYQRAQQLLDEVGAAPGDLATRIVMCLEGRDKTYYQEMHMLVAVVNDCLDRVGSLIGFTREYSDDPGFELSEVIDALQSVSQMQGNTINSQNSQLQRIQAILTNAPDPVGAKVNAISVERIRELMKLMPVNPETAAEEVADDRVVPVGRVSNRPAREETAPALRPESLGPDIDPRGATRWSGPNEMIG